MWALVEGATTHGIAKGALPASVNRDRTYLPGKEVGAALLEMSEVIGGPDFELEPVAGAGTETLARLNTFYPRQGSDKSADVIFVHGAAPYTASDFNFAPGGDGICNRVVVVGAPLNNEGEEAEENPFATFPAYVAEHAASIAQYGVWEQLIQLEDVSEAATLQAHAEAFVAANALPIPYFDFTAAPEQTDEEEGDGVPPVFGVDYWIGDTIACHTYLGAASIREDDGKPLDAAGAPVVPLKLTGRVTDATVTELESGQIAVKVTCAAEVVATGITGNAIILRVPEAAE
jgi:hypothetical protein